MYYFTILVFTTFERMIKEGSPLAKSEQTYLNIWVSHSFKDSLLEWTKVQEEGKQTCLDI